MLFIMVVETMSVYLKTCDSVKGIKIDNETFLITQLADDTTLFLKDQKSITHAMYVLEKFYECSGLRLNRQKCELFLLGNFGQCNNTPTSICGLKRVSGPFKALGVYFSNNTLETVHHNFVNKMKKFHILVNIWMQRDLSLKGKIIALKSILLPTVLFQCNNLFVPDWFITQINCLLFKFLWNNKPAKIKWESIVADIEEGGLRMPHFPSIVQSHKVMWIKRLLDNQDSKWKKLAWTLMNVSEFDLRC